MEPCRKWRGYALARRRMRVADAGGVARCSARSTASSPPAAGSGPFGRLTVGLLARLLHRLGANFDQAPEAIQSSSQTRQDLGAHVVVVGHGGSIPAPPVISRDRLGRRDPGKCEKTHISRVLTESDVIVTNAGRWSGRTRGPGRAAARGRYARPGASRWRSRKTALHSSPARRVTTSVSAPVGSTTITSAGNAVARLPQQQMLGPDAVDDVGWPSCSRRVGRQRQVASRRRRSPPAARRCGAPWLR